MGIWLKKFKYGKFLKILASIILCLMMIILAEMTCYQDMTWSDFGMSYSTYEYSYYDSAFFKQYYITKVGYVRDWIVRYSDPAVFTPEGITDAEVEAYKETAKGLQIRAESQRERLNNDEYITKIKEAIIEDRKDYFEMIKDELLLKDKSFIYLAWDSKTGKVVTNIPDYSEPKKEEILLTMSKNPAYLIGNAKNFTYDGEIQDHINYYVDNDTMTDEEANRYKIHAMIDEFKIAQDDPGDKFSVDKKNFEQIQEIGNVLKSVFMVLFLLGIVAGLYLIFSEGKRFGDNNIHITSMDKIWLELQGVGVLIAETVLMSMTFKLENSAISVKILRKMHFRPFYNVVSADTVILYIIVTSGTLLAIWFGLSIVRRAKAHVLLKTTLVYSLYDFFRKALFGENTLGIGVTAAAILYVIINTFLAGVFAGGRSFIIFCLLILFNMFVMAAIIIFAVDYQKILTGAKQIAGGNLGYKITPISPYPISIEMAQTINNIGEGLERAAESAVRSERFKTELITNVSHDLKTPLTSIISYIELLQQEPIGNEEARKYIDILAERSEKLKRLIEDLIEASKATTGNLAVAVQPIQLDELVKQIIGEYGDKLEGQGLDIIYSRIQETTILADGKHMWRVLENLVTNLIKYAMPSTRVYLDVFSEGGYGILTIKNVSKDPLNIDALELTKRFVRGDESRTEEGFGLGLAIAQSLVQLQKGKFDITIDGDLFKVCIQIPLFQNGEKINLSKQ